MPDNRKRLDPWTFRELHPSGSPRDPDGAQLAGPAHPPRPARATRQAPLPTRPCWGAPAGCRLTWASCRDVCRHRFPPDWRASTEAPQGGHLPHSPPRSPPPPPHCHDGRGSAARGRVGATRGLRRGPTPRAAPWLGLLAGTAHTGSTTRTSSTRIQPPPTRFGAISARRGSGRRRRQRSRHQRPFTLSHSHWRWRAWLRRCRLAHAMAARALRLRILSCFEIRRPGPRRGSRACCLQDVVQQAAQAGER